LLSKAPFPPLDEGVETRAHPSSCVLLHVHVNVPDVGGGGGEVVVHPELVEAEAEGDDVEGHGHRAALGDLAGRLGDVVAEVVGLVIKLLGQLEVLHEGHAVVVKGQGHHRELQDAPDAQQGAAQRQLGPANPEIDHDGV